MDWKRSPSRCWSSLRNGHVMELRWTRTIDHILMANKTVNELKATHEVLRILPIGAMDGIWMTIVDASMANVENKSQGGFIVAYANGKIMHGERADFSINSWKSHRLKRVIKATLGSEALAMDDALGEVEWIRALWHEVMNPSSSVMDGSRLGPEPSAMVVKLPDEEPEDVRSIRVKDDRTGIHVTDALRPVAPAVRKCWTRPSSSNRCGSDPRERQGHGHRDVLGAR